MKVFVLTDADGSTLLAAKDYHTAVAHLFGDRYISEKEEIYIDNEWTTLEEYFGEDVVDMMTNIWDIDDFNEFWSGDFVLYPMEVLE